MSPSHHSLNACVVIPTMRRQNGFQYLERSLAHHGATLRDRSIFGDRFLFLDKSDEAKLRPLIAQHGLKPLHREPYPQLDTLEPGSYDYWRSHLCLDFAHSMGRALEASAGRYFIWLEDDTHLSAQFGREFQKFVNTHPAFKTASANHAAAYQGGFACIIFEREALAGFITLVKSRCLENIPLDWMYKYCGYEFKTFPRRCAFHRGQYSSRIDRKVERVVEHEKLIDRTKYRLASKLKSLGRSR